MAVTVIHVRVRQRWWVPVYIWTIAVLCALLNAEPDWNRVCYWLRRGTYVTFK